MVQVTVDLLGSCLLSLLLVNEFHENSLVLEHITLSFKIQLMVQVTVDLLGLPVSLEKSPKYSHSSNPQSLLASSGILGTLPLTKATVTTLATGFIISANSRSGVDSNRLFDDKTILDQFSNILPGVGISNLIDFIRVKPNLIFATFHDICRKALLELERTHF